MGLFKEFKTDKAREAKGIFFERAGARLTLARAGGNNAEFKAHTSRLRMEKGKSFASMEAEEIFETNNDSYSRTVVRKWETWRDGQWVEGIENPEDESGPLLPDTVENRKMVFALIPDFLSEVIEMSGNFALFRVAIVNDIVKN